MTLVLKNTFLQQERLLVPARARARSHSHVRIREDAGSEDEKLKPLLSDDETELGSQDALTEFPLTDDESSYSYEPPAVDFELAAKENVRLLRQKMSKPHREITSNSSSGSSSCGACPMPMPMPMLGASGLFPNAALMQPMFSIVMMDPGKQAVKSQDEASSRKHKQRAKASGKQEEKHSDDTRTTVMLRNLPRDISRAALLKLLDDKGFAGKYNFLYTPIDFVRHTNLGYAFVNMETPDVVKEFWEAFDGFSAWPVACDKVCRVNWSSPHQGYDEHVQRYRNSPLMHKDVPDECRPVLLENGMRVEFPPPTKSLRAPRLRAAQRRAPFWDQEQAETSDKELVHEDEADL